MAIIQAVLAAVGRAAGKILNTVFGWATAMLFGKVPKERQIFLSIMAFASVIWLVVLAGIASPSVATFLLGFVTLPNWVDQNWIRLAMLVAAIVVPLIVGFIALGVLAPDDQPKTVDAKLRAVLRGYPITLGLSTTLIMLTVFAPIMKAQTILQGWTSQHVPVIVEPPEYMQVVDELQRALKTGRWDTQRVKASWMLSAPTKVITLLAGGALKNFIADNLTTLRGKTLEVALYPADLMVKGNESDVAHARAVIAEQLAFSEAYMTWSKEANELEDRIGSIWRDLKEKGRNADLRRASEDLKTVTRDIKSAQIEYEEWEVLFREKMLVERGLLELEAGVVDRLQEPAEATSEQLVARHKQAALPDLRLSLVPLVPIVAAAVLLALRRRTFGHRP